MKLLVIILVLFAQSSYGQTWSEWFRQKKTQKRYLLEQISALKLYGGYLAKGYAITKGGLKTIGGLKQGCFEQDEKFVESLKIVSPRVKEYKRVADIIAIHLRISKMIQKELSYSTTNGMLTSEEKGYMRGVFDKVKVQSEADIDHLTRVITDAKLEMSDDARILEVDKLYASAVDQQSLVQSFSSSMRGLVVQRLQEVKEVKRSKLLNGIR